MTLLLLHFRLRFDGALLTCHVVLPVEGVRDRFALPVELVTPRSNFAMFRADDGWGFDFYGHEVSFSAADAFLKNGGQRGPQLSVLTSGAATAVWNGFRRVDAA